MRLIIMLKLLHIFKRFVFWAVSDKSYQGQPQKNQPVLIRKHPESKLVFHRNVKLGWSKSPFYYSGYINIRIDNPEGRIQVGENTTINNNAHIYCNSPFIEIGKNCLIGPQFYCIDSDGHDLDPKKRRGGIVKTAPIKIWDNVFIGARVIILKGVEIGENSVIAAGSVVSRSFPKNSVIGGNPAQLIKTL